MTDNDEIAIEVKSGQPGRALLCVRIAPEIKHWLRMRMGATGLPDTPEGWNSAVAMLIGEAMSAEVAG